MASSEIRFYNERRRPHFLPSTSFVDFISSTSFMTPLYVERTLIGYCASLEPLFFFFSSLLSSPSLSFLSCWVQFVIWFNQAVDATDLNTNAWRNAFYFTAQIMIMAISVGVDIVLFACACIIRQ